MHSPSVRLRRDLHYLEAMQTRQRVKVIRDHEYVGYGRIIDVGPSTVTILDAADESIAYFLRDACEFYAET
ncbi:hypothetical protein MO973_05450 [Paenibacillus sp. TRM 82003]|nr:hypothetical protein [Paenibacillus sp. TRM 82003]